MTTNPDDLTIEEALAIAHDALGFIEQSFVDYSEETFPYPSAVSVLAGALDKLTKVVEAQHKSDKRHFGSARGQVEMTPDFNAEMELVQRGMQWEVIEHEPNYRWQPEGDFITFDVEYDPDYDDWCWRITNERPGTPHEYRYYNMAEGRATSSDAAKVAVEQWLAEHGKEYGIEVK